MGPTLPAPEAVDASLRHLRHRGPDGEGRFSEPGVLLAMRRLAVIDLEGGDQPIANEDGTVVVVCNGEIYNYLELRRELIADGHTFRTSSDVEVLVHLYERHGDELATHLRGMFAFALWDSRRRRLLLGRDRFGKKPLYLARTPGGGLCFASELKGLLPLLRGLGVEPRLREQALYDYLSLAVVPQPGTVYEGVETLGPATLAAVESAADGAVEVRARRYWSLPSPSPGRQPAAEDAERLRELVGEAVALRLRSDVRVGLFLSGGIDSSVIAAEAAARHRGGEPLTAFTIAVDDPAFDESALAARTARHHGLDHVVLPLRVSPREELERLVEAYDQPFADPSAIPSLAVARLAAEHVRVVLNGDGGDEIFAGYRRHLAAHWSDRLDRLPGALPALQRLLGLLPRTAVRRSPLGFAARFARGLRLEPGARYLVWTSDMLLEADKQGAWLGSPCRPTEEAISAALPAAVNGFETQRRGDLEVNLLSDLLVKMDIATMAASLEGRSPLLDHRVAEWVAPMPARVLLAGGQTKALLREAYRDRLLPEVLAGRKRGFEIPLAGWLRGELRELLADTVGSPAALVRDHLDPRLVDAVLTGRGFGDRNAAYLVYSFLVLELWLRRHRASARLHRGSPLARAAGAGTG